MVQINADNSWGTGAGCIADLTDGIMGMFPRELTERNSHKRVNIIKGPHPRCLPGSGGDYKIEITSPHEEFDHATYELSHELCHLLMGCEKWPDPPDRNIWFREAICEMASHFILVKFTRHWGNIRKSLQYVPEQFAYYSSGMAARHGQHECMDQAPIGWFAANEAVLEQGHRYTEPAMRAKQYLVAQWLISIFTKNPKSWASILDLPQSAGPFACYLYRWWQASDAHKAVIKGIADFFGLPTSTWHI